MIGVEVGIPMSLLGMTFLAWGNSMGDFANNIAMAKRGIPEMSITAVFAGEAACAALFKSRPPTFCSTV